MLTYAKIALLLLQAADGLINLWRSKQQYDAGVDAEIAKASAAILVKTKVAQEQLQLVTGLTDAQVDEMLKGLEPK